MAKKIILGHYFIGLRRSIRNDSQLASSQKTRFNFCLIVLSYILIINNSHIIHIIVTVLITTMFKIVCLNILLISSRATCTLVYGLQQSSQ